MAHVTARTWAGDGVLASLLTPKPIDLTQIAKQNGGTFPAIKVAQTIDGMTMIRAHGTSEMPVWGEAFQGERREGRPAGHRSGMAQISVITNYIRSIQEK